MIMAVQYNHNILSDLQVFFHQAGSCQMEGITALYNYIMGFLIGILCVVTSALVIIIFFHLHGRRHVHQYKFEKNLDLLIDWLKYVQRWTHSTMLELVWTIVPTTILIAIAIPSFILLYSLDEIVDTQTVIKVTAFQWYWKYEYPVIDPDTGDVINFSYLSYMLPTEDLTEVNNLRLLEVDMPLVAPINVNIKFIITSKDVIHSFAIPALGIKMDAVPGRLNQVTVHIYKPGIYFGQCSELCGVNHAFMPIALHAVDFNTFENFLLKAIGITNKKEVVTKEILQEILQEILPANPPIIFLTAEDITTSGEVIEDFEDLKIEENEPENLEIEIIKQPENKNITNDEVFYPNPLDFTKEKLRSLSIEEWVALLRPHTKVHIVPGNTPIETFAKVAEARDKYIGSLTKNVLLSPEFKPAEDDIELMAQRSIALNYFKDRPIMVEKIFCPGCYDVIKSIYKQGPYASFEKAVVDSIIDKVTLPKDFKTNEVAPKKEFKEELEQALKEVLEDENAKLECVDCKKKDTNVNVKDTNVNVKDTSLYDDMVKIWGKDPFYFEKIEERLLKNGILCEFHRGKLDLSELKMLEEIIRNYEYMKDMTNPADFKTQEEYEQCMKMTEEFGRTAPRSYLKSLKK